jgi:hypothetical protein
VDNHYLTLDHTTSVFSLPFDYQRSSSNLHQPTTFSPQSHQHSLSVSTTIPDLTILEFISWTANLRKQLHKNLKYNT